jgi:ribulose 1,5-bisphosphate synthetase/thiazole synthase
MNKYLKIDFEKTYINNYGAEEILQHHVGIALNKQEEYYVARFSEESLGDLITTARNAGLKISLKDI